MDTVKKKNFSLRIPEPLLRRARYASEYEGRSLNQQIMLLMRDFVATFEQKHGEITQQDLELLHL